MFFVTESLKFGVYNFICKREEKEMIGRICTFPTPPNAFDAMSNVVYALGRFFSRTPIGTILCIKPELEDLSRHLKKV